MLDKTVMIMEGHRLKRAKSHVLRQALCSTLDILESLSLGFGL